jgi:hypothetical protein
MAKLPQTKPPSAPRQSATSKRRSASSKQAVRDEDTILVARATLTNIVRWLDAVRSTTAVCRFALAGSNTDESRHTQNVLEWWISNELSDQIARIDLMIRVEAMAPRPRGPVAKAMSPKERAEDPAISVSRAELQRIAARLTPLVDVAAACRNGIKTQHHIARALEHAVIMPLQKQIDRMAAISRARPKAGEVIVSLRVV